MHLKDIKNRVLFTLCITSILTSSVNINAANSGEGNYKMRIVKDIINKQKEEESLELQSNDNTLLNDSLENSIDYLAMNVDQSSFIDNAFFHEENKVDTILEEYALTEDQFLAVNATVIAEAKADSYDDQYHVISTIYNRTHSKTWVNSYGASLFSQISAPHQFSAYQNRRYYQVYGTVSDAVVDCLYEKEPSHDYLSFKSSGSNIAGVQFVAGGNKYHNVLNESDRIVEEKEYVRER